MDLHNTWHSYKSWAARSRQLQAETRRSAQIAVALTCVAAVLGAVAALLAEHPVLGKLLAIAAAVFAALVPILGKDILSVGAEGRWIKARATAEAIKSECHRYAAGCGIYATPGAEADAQFLQQLEAIAKPALDDGVTRIDPKPQTYETPPVPLDLDWYIVNRLEEQRAYYAEKQMQNEAAVKQQRLQSLGFAVLTAVLGVLAAFIGLRYFAPFIAASTTVSAALAAYGLIDRRQFLAASYGAMVQRLDDLMLRAKALNYDVRQLAEAGEDLLSAETRIWSNRLAEKPFEPPMMQENDNGSA